MRRSARKRGISLVEVIIAMGIMAMLIVPIYNLLSVSQRGIHQTAARLQSKIYSADLMDMLVTLTYDELPPYSEKKNIWSGDSSKLYDLLKKNLKPIIHGAFKIQDVFNVEDQYKRTISIERHNYQDDPVQINFYYKIIKVKTEHTNKKGKETSFMLTNMVKK